MLPPFTAAVPEAWFTAKLFKVVVPPPTAPLKVVIALSLMIKFCNTVDPVKASTVLAKLILTPVKVVFVLLETGLVVLLSVTRPL